MQLSFWIVEYLELHHTIDKIRYIMLLNKFTLVLFLLLFTLEQCKGSSQPVEFGSHAGHPIQTDQHQYIDKTELISMNLSHRPIPYQPISSGPNATVNSSLQWVLAGAGGKRDEKRKVEYKLLQLVGQ